MISIIIFSKDRACQLDLFLRSMHEHYPDCKEADISIIYKASNQEYQKGYDILIKSYKKIKFIQCNNSNFFKQYLYKIVKANFNGQIHFFTDDDVFVRPYTHKCDEFQSFINEPTNIACLSLKLGSHINYGYTMKCGMPPPVFIKDYMWNWKQQKNTSDWYYPMSIDGHVFRAKEILPVIARARYMAPNSLEQALADECPVVGSKMICFEQSKIINIPCNKVQTENTNHAGMLHPATTESLNSEFLKGKQISTENIYGIVCNSVHVELPLKLIQKEAKIGILLIATNRYIEFINPLIESINKFFLTDYEKHFFLFTNKDAPDGVKKIHIDHKPWPNMTLYRYNIFAANESLFQDMDYLYYLDADMIVVDKVGNEILGETVGTSHPGFYNRERSCFTYETNSQSMACISANQGKTYYAGGFVGGSREGFMAMCRTIRKWVDKDASNGITAVWHDESHLNKYFMLHPPQVTLTPDYCHHTYPAWNLPPKIVAIYKVHSEYRDV